MAEESFKRRLTAILSADVEGYSRLMREDEEATVRTLTNYRTAIVHFIEQYRGRVVDSPGDNILAEFTSVVDAVNCGVEIQRELAERNAELPEDRRMQFRIGINLGDVLEEGERIYGDGVNIAARMESLAEAGEICISGTVYDAIENKIGLEYEYLGEHEVKNIDKPIRTYRVLSYPGAAAHRVVRAKKAVGKTWRNTIIAIAAVLGLGAAAAFWHFYFHPPPIEPASAERMVFPLPDKPSIAVLPFDNLSGDPKQAYLADGLTENIIGGLSKIPEMFVIARNTTFTYKDKPVKVQQVAEELGVRYVLEGSMQISAEQLRVTAQLIDALKGHHVWSEKYDRKMEHFFSVQDDITLNIAIALQVKLTEGEQARVRHSTENLEAWALAVEAHSLFETYTRENIAKARELFKKAVELDPNYAYVWSYLGWTYWIDGVYHSAHYDREKCFESASKMAEKALSFDTKSSDAHALLSSVYLSQKKYDEAEAFGKKTIKLDPNSSENHAIVAITMQNIGKFEEAIALVKQAMRLNPYYPNWYLYRLGACYRMMGKYEESAKALEEMLRRDRESGTAAPWDRLYLYLASTYSMMGRLEEARDYVSKALEFNPKMTVSLWGKRFQYKDPKHTERILDALRKAGLPETPPLPLPDKPSIAVLPFVNMSGDPEQEYFSDGITEEVITALSKTPKMFVIARTSSFKYKGKEVDVRTVGRELGVCYVLEGSFRRSKDQLRITAQLVDAKTGNHLWAERYERDLGEIFAIQDDITKEILTSLQVTLTEGEQARFEASGTNSLEAYLKLLEGRQIYRKLNKEDNALGRAKCEEAIGLDPQYARAYAALSSTYVLDVALGVNPQEAMTKAYEYARKAISLDETQLYAHYALEFVYGFRRQYEEAIASGKRAIEFAPGAADAYFSLGRALNFACRDKEAIGYLERAIRLNPFPPSHYYMHLGWAYFNLRNHEQAVSALKKALALSPQNIPARACLMVAYVEMGKMEEAKTEREKLLKMAPGFNSGVLKKRRSVWKDPEVTERWVEASSKLESEANSNAD